MKTMKNQHRTAVISTVLMAMSSVAFCQESAEKYLKANPKARLAHVEKSDVVNRKAADEMDVSRTKLEEELEQATATRIYKAKTDGYKNGKLVWFKSEESKAARLKELNTLIDAKRYEATEMRERGPMVKSDMPRLVGDLKVGQIGQLRNAIVGSIADDKSCVVMLLPDRQFVYVEMPTSGLAVNEPLRTSREFIVTSSREYDKKTIFILSIIPEDFDWRASTSPK